MSIMWGVGVPRVGLQAMPHRDSDVLNHPARAVVPQPRLRAKWIVFSPPLRTTPGGSDWALAWRCREVEPAEACTEGVSFKRYGCFTLNEIIFQILSEQFLSCRKSTEPFQKIHCIYLHSLPSCNILI